MQTSTSSLLRNGMQTSTSSLLSRAQALLGSVLMLAKAVDFDGIRALAEKIKAVPDRQFNLDYVTSAGGCGCALGWAMRLDEKKRFKFDYYGQLWQQPFDYPMTLSDIGYKMFGTNRIQTTELFGAVGTSPFDSMELIFDASLGVYNSDVQGAIHKKLFEIRLKKFMEKYDVRQPKREQPAQSAECTYSTDWSDMLSDEVWDGPELAERGSVVCAEPVAGASTEPGAVQAGERIHADVATLLRECSQGLRGSRQPDRQGSAPSRRVAAERAEVA